MAATPTYQLILLGAGAAVHGGALANALRTRLAEIGTDLDQALGVLGAAEIAKLDPRSPAIAVYFGGDSATDTGPLSQLLADAVPVLPVVENLEAFPASVPDALHPINGIQWRPGLDLSALVNLILENLSLLRRTRRLFLSYRRHESAVVAHQLRSAFDELGFDAFLDTSSVPRGDDFQAVLWHRLLDSDVMIVLDTADFLGSRWTQLEIANASAMAVGILQVLWPGVVRATHSQLAVPLQLATDDVDGDALTPQALARITCEVEALRARCLAARHTNLVVEFCEEAQRAGAHTAVQPERYVLAELPCGRRIAAIPAVGVPDARRYHEASALFTGGGVTADEALLIYDHRGMLPQWMTFLDWLDDFLPVKGLKVTDTAVRLGAP